MRQKVTKFHGQTGVVTWQGGSVPFKGTDVTLDPASGGVELVMPEDVSHGVHLVSLGTLVLVHCTPK